jgi:hypothetical protein
MKINIEIPDNAENNLNHSYYQDGWALDEKWLDGFKEYLINSYSPHKEEIEDLELYVLESILLGLESYVDILKEKNNVA